MLPVDHEPAQTEPPPGLERLLGDLGRCDEEGDLVLQRSQHQTRGTTDQQNRQDHQSQPLLLAQSHG